MAYHIISMRETFDRALKDEKRPWTKYFAMAEEKTGISRFNLFMVLIVFVAVYLVFGYGSQLLCNIIGFVYPAYCSMKAIESQQKEDDTKWLTYWVVFATFSVIEYFSNFIAQCIPGYWLLKCVFLVWCFLPFSYNGSNHIYKNYIRVYFLKHQNQVDSFINEVGDRIVKASTNIKSK